MNSHKAGIDRLILLTDRRVLFGLPGVPGQKKGNPFGSPNRNCEKLQYISPSRPQKSSPFHDRLILFDFGG
jgi:hypothetical protein